MAEFNYEQYEAELAKVNEVLRDVCVLLVSNAGADGARDSEGNPTDESIIDDPVAIVQRMATEIRTMAQNMRETMGIDI